MEEELKKLIDDNCHGCEYPCEKGIVETPKEEKEAPKVKL